MVKEALSVVGIAASIGMSIWAAIVLKKRKQTGLRPQDYYVEEPVAPGLLEIDGFVVIARFQESFMADLCRQKLEVEGIECVVLNQPTVGTERDLRLEGGIRIAVRSEDSENAASLIREVG